MNRRAFLATAASGSALIAGCSQVEELATEATGGGTTIGDTATFGEIEVTVTDSMTADQITINGNEKTSPENGTYALFEVESYNTDVTERDAPHVSPKHYETLEKEENTIYTGDINDIRVFGSGEGGHFPDLDRETEMMVDSGQFELGFDGESRETYPVGTIRPTVDADSTIAGWTVGVIDADATPELKINFNGTEETWTADG